MTDMSQFERDMDEQFVEHVEKPLVEAQKITVEEVYDRILDRAPVWSGYYKSNHRIMLSGDSEAELDPADKIEHAEQGTYLGNVERARSQEFNKLQDIEPYSIVTVGTAVSYAGDVEVRHAVYAQGAIEGSESAASIINDMPSIEA